MPNYRIQKKFAWRPVLTTSGKWLWWQSYVKLTKEYYGIVGEGIAYDKEIFTTGEWFLETIKKDYNAGSRPTPPVFARSSVVRRQ